MPKNTQQLLISSVLLLILTSCQTNPSKQKSTPAPPSSSPSSAGMPSTPSAGTQSTPSASKPSAGQPSAPKPPSTQSGEQSDSPSSSSDTSGEPQDSSALPEEWETDPASSQQGEGDGSGAGEEITFDETDMGDGEPSLYESEGGGLSESELEDLEKELDESLGDFDEEIQRQQTYAEERANEKVGSGAPEDGVGEFESYQDGDEGEELEEVADAQAAGEGGSSPGGDSSDNSRQSTGQKGEKSNTPDDIPDGRDDDIVARQIREAAEAETDSELREKLWEEYRNYKNQ